MQALSEIRTGAVCTIKWMFGTPEVLEFLHRHQIQEGSTIRVIQNRVENLIIGTDAYRIVIESDAAQMIKV